MEDRIQPLLSQWPMSGNDEVIKAIKSFLSDSAGGPDSLRPQHLKNMISPSANAGGQSHICHPYLRWFCRARHHHPFAHTSLMLTKSIGKERRGGGGVAIAVGFTMQLKLLETKLWRKWHPFYLHVSLGMESAKEQKLQFILYINNLGSNKAVLKLDFINAFNSIRRDKMLNAVKLLAPSIYPFVHSAYSSSSSYFWGDKIIPSAEGVQQGDPIGPLLFCLTHVFMSWCSYQLEPSPRFS